MQKGKLYLIPVTLGETDLHQSLPQSVFDAVNNINFFIAENIKSAVNFLKKAEIKKNIKDLAFYELNVNTKEDDIVNYLDEALKGNDIGLLSEAGAPCIADPGSSIVLAAHQKGIPVVPLSGPSSIILALMASGLNGQEFTFNGYLPIEKEQRKQAIRDLEKKIKSGNVTQIFIEAPHRNDRLLEELIHVCNDNLKLCVAKNLTLEDEMIVTKSIRDWKKISILLGKNPSMFLLGS